MSGFKEFQALIVDGRKDLKKSWELQWTFLIRIMRVEKTIWSILTDRSWYQVWEIYGCVCVYNFIEKYEQLFIVVYNLKVHNNSCNNINTSTYNYNLLLYLNLHIFLQELYSKRRLMLCSHSQNRNFNNNNNNNNNNNIF